MADVVCYSATDAEEKTSVYHQRGDHRCVYVDGRSNNIFGGRCGQNGQFLHFYPEFKTEFSLFRDQLHTFNNNLFKNYISCYIKKEKPLNEFPQQYKTHMFKLHEKYINELKPNNLYVNDRVVINYINSIPASHQMYSLNYNLRKHHVDNNHTTLI